MSLGGKVEQILWNKSSDVILPLNKVTDITLVTIIQYRGCSANMPLHTFLHMRLYILHLNRVLS